MTEQYIGALDQGTTSTRFMLFTTKGDEVPNCKHQINHATFEPHPGWEEQDPLEILENCKRCIDECVTKAGENHGITPQQITVIGITNQRETTVVWDRNTGQPLHRAILWKDGRTNATADYLRTKISSEKVRSITGLPIFTYFSGVKLRWMMDKVPEVKQAIDNGTAMFGTIDTWLIWNLTTDAAFVTDVTNAGRTMLMNIRDLKWDQTMMDLIGISTDILPEIRSCSEKYGEMKGTLLKGTPIAGLIGDQQAALVGQACFEVGEVKNTYGTGCFLIVNTGDQPKFSTKGLLTTPAYQIGPDAKCMYSLEGSIAVAGAVVEWLKNDVQLIQSASEIEALASTVEDTGDVYCVPAFSGLFAPRWRQDARGTICGITQYTRRAHIARAILASITYQVNDVLVAASEDMGAPITELRVDGGASVNNLLLKMQADITQANVVRPKVFETTALGAAFAAGHAVGLFQSPQEFREHWEEDHRAVPDITEEERQARLSKWEAAVERSLGWTEAGKAPATSGWRPSKDVVIPTVAAVCASLITAVAMKCSKK